MGAGIEMLDVYQKRLGPGSPGATVEEMERERILGLCHDPHRGRKSRQTWCSFISALVLLAGAVAVMGSHSHCRAAQKMLRMSDRIDSLTPYISALLFSLVGMQPDDQASSGSCALFSD